MTILTPSPSHVFLDHQKCSLFSQASMPYTTVPTFAEQVLDQCGYTGADQILFSQVNTRLLAYHAAGSQECGHIVAVEPANSSCWVSANWCPGQPCVWKGVPREI
jgi:hypothetical protein